MGGRLGAFVVALAFLAMTPSADAATHSVAIRDVAYNPASLTIAPGDTVVWTNFDSIAATGGHTVTSKNGAFQGCGSAQLPMKERDTCTVHFTAPGTYPYHCEIHSSMNGTISVKVSAIPASHSPTPSPTPTPKPSASTKVTTSPSTRATPSPSASPSPSATSPSPSPSPTVTLASGPTRAGHPSRWPLALASLLALLIAAGLVYVRFIRRTPG